MELIADLPFVGGFLSSLIAFVVVLGIVVFVHEYGHYIVGRWCGIKAEVFSLGFGPRLGGWTDKRGTRWQVAALPLGGYVKFLGDADGSSRADPDALSALSEDERAKSFHTAALWKRSLTVAAGPVANFILSILVFAGLTIWTGIATDEPVLGEIRPVPGVETGLQSGDRVIAINGQPVQTFADIYTIADEMLPATRLDVTVQRDGAERQVTAPYPLPAMVQAVEPLSAAQAAGLKPGDLVLSANGVVLESFRDLRDAVEGAGDGPLAMVVRRGADEIPLSMTPRETERLLPDGTIETRRMIGVVATTLLFPETSTPAPWTALWLGVEQTVEVVTLSLTGIKEIILGNLGADNLQGPIGIAQVSGQSATQGVENLITIIAVISTAIGMLNLFPIPVLDGGHLMMFGYEAIAGRPPAEVAMRIAMTIGLAMVLALMVFATYNDLMRLLLS
ncbi:MAG: RIP metalloprotease RseP [Pseudomonadota bacterium]